MVDDYIGCLQTDLTGKCASRNLTCGLGNNQDGESSTSVMSSSDLRNWINIAISETGYRGPYTKVQNDPLFMAPNEDPFVWRDKRGHYHMLLHSVEADGGFGAGPKVGRHAFARNYSGPWTFDNRTLAFSTEVKYNDGSTTNYYRRERPQLYFSDDGEMTPLLMTTGVQPVNSTMSLSIIVPVSDDGLKMSQ